MTDTVHDVMALAALLDAAARLEVAAPGRMHDAFDGFLTALSPVVGKTRAELDALSTPELHALMQRAAMGDGYADALDVAREAWNGD